MSAAELAPRESEPQLDGGPDPEVLQDILYDMLASGVDEQSGVSQAQIEDFLHEHARSPKSAAEFRAFFDRHGLLCDAIAHESAILELPPITTVREAERPIMDRPIELALTDIEEIEWQAPKALMPPPARSTAVRLGWAALALLGAALIAVAWRGYTMIHELRSDLSQASERTARDHHALQRLSDQAASLESSVAATGELIQRVDEKSDLLLDSLLPPNTTKANPSSERR